MDNETFAWLLDIGGYQVAVGEREMLHLLHTEEAMIDNQTVIWQEQALSILNLQIWLNGEASIDFPFVGIVALGEQQDQTGAIYLADKPRRITLREDTPLAELPDPQEKWQQLAISCFSHQNIVTPVLDMPLIFSNNWN